MENSLEKELEVLARAVLEIKAKAKIENICQDDYETMIIDTLHSVGFAFSR
jgi:hypothetical protein